MSIHIKCIIGTQLIDGADELNQMRKRDTERVQSGGDVRNGIKNHCFRTLILKLVNPLESLEDRITIHL